MRRTKKLIFPGLTIYFFTFHLTEWHNNSVGFKEKDKLITVKVDTTTTLTLSKSSIAGIYGKIDDEDLR